MKKHVDQVAVVVAKTMSTKYPSGYILFLLNCLPYYRRLSISAITISYTWFPLSFEVGVKYTGIT